MIQYVIMHAKSVDLLSVNMSINNGDPEKRWTAFLDYFLKYQPDVGAIQEVSSDVGLSSLELLHQKLGPDYEMKYETVYPGQEDEQGVAVISRIPITKSEQTQIDEGRNQIQVVDLRTGGNKDLVVANAHLEAFPWQEFMRMRKLGKLAQVLEVDFPDYAKVIAGDFNSMPFMPTVKNLKKQGYQSAFEAIYGTEPSYTYPTLVGKDLVDERYVKPQEYMFYETLGKVMPSTRRIGSKLAHMAIDYILIKDACPISAGMVKGRDQVFSDHMGLRTRISLANS
jgi:endonuclease/exonuclease/phosphatase family metal-dependent hydrolase